MEIINLKENDNITSFQDIVLCLGFFDGVHLGHQKLFAAANKYPYKKGVLTFYGNFKKAKLINTFQEKVMLLKQYDIDYLFVIEINEKLIKTTCEEFIKKYLAPLHPKIIICGEDFRFGYNNCGDWQYLKQFFNVEVIPLLKIDGIKISSSLIRQLLKDGEIDKVNKYLGHNYFILGKINKGLGNGTKLGFKTANIDTREGYQMLKNGVYLTKATINNKKYNSITNVGVHPSISKLDKPIIEVHIFDGFDFDVGDEIYLEFVSFIRDEKHFENVDLLKKQVLSDIDFAKSYFKKNQP